LVFVLENLATMRVAAYLSSNLTLRKQSPFVAALAASHPPEQVSQCGDWLKMRKDFTVSNLHSKIWQHIL
jgi:hypothetical protein